LDDASNRGRVVTSVLVIAELFYGAAKSTLVTNDGALLVGDIEGLVAENWI
jgi:predicted nucleic acid-binding protein